MATATLINNKTVHSELEKEKNAILQLCSEYQKNKDEKIANKINELNLHMHAKISVLSENMKPVDVKDLEKLQEEANKGVEAAAKTHSMKVEYVDIRNIEVTANGATKKLHKHLNDVLENATDSNSFVSLLPTEVQKAITKVNLDKDILVNGDKDFQFAGLMELNELHRNSGNQTAPQPTKQLSQEEIKVLNNLAKNANDVKTINPIINSKEMSAALTEGTIKELLLNNNPKISKLVAESDLIKTLKINDVRTLLNTGAINKQAVTGEVIHSIFSNENIINVIGESAYQNKNLKSSKTQNLIETLAAEKIYEILKDASEGKRTTLAGGQFAMEAIAGLAGNKKAMEVTRRNNHDIVELYKGSSNILSMPTTPKGFIVANATAFLTGIGKSETFWNELNATQLDTLIKIPVSKKLISENPIAAKNLNQKQATDLFTDGIANPEVTKNHELLNKIPQTSLDTLMKNSTLNKEGLLQNEALDSLGLKYLDPKSPDFILGTSISTIPQQLLIILAQNDNLFIQNNNLSNTVKKRLVNTVILGNFNNTSIGNAQLNALLIAAFSNPELVNYAGKSKIMLFFNNFNAVDCMKNNPELLKVLTPKNIESLIDPKSNFAQIPESLSTLMSNESVINKLGTQKINEFIDNYNDVSKRTKELEEVVSGLIINNGVVFNGSDLTSYLKNGGVAVREAIASRIGVEELLTKQEMDSLFNDPDPAVRDKANSNMGLLLRYLTA